MKLKQRLNFLIISAYLLFAATVWILLVLVLNPAVDRIERDYARDQAAETRQILLAELNNLATLTHDWASRDETYYFIQQENPGFITTNLNLANIKNLSLNFVNFSDLNGDSVFSIGLNVNRDPADELADESKLILAEHNQKPTGILSGLIQTSLGPMLIARQPILDSNGKGPAAGSLTLGRLIDRQLMDGIQTISGNLCVLEPVSSEADVMTQNYPKIHKISDSSFQVSNLYLDIYNQPIMVSHTRVKTDITRSGIHVIKIAVGSFALFGVLAWGLLYYFISFWVLRPITTLSRHLSESDESNLSPLNCNNHNDEIAGLYDRYNKLIGKIQLQQKEMKKLASTDPLTQLFNRRYFEVRFAEEWQRSRRELSPMSILLCDIDYFKQYNDYYGHPQGDICLQTVASHIQKRLRPTDIVARYGGEEFIILLPNTDRIGTEQVAQKLLNMAHELKMEHLSSPASDHVTLSIGGSTTIAVGEDRDQLIKSADLALYEAKENGRNQFVFKMSGTANTATG